MKTDMWDRDLEMDWSERNTGRDAKGRYCKICRRYQQREYAKRKKAAA